MYLGFNGLSSCICDLPSQPLSRLPTRSLAVWNSPTRRPTRGRRSWRSWLRHMTATLRSAATCAKAPRYSLSTTHQNTHASVWMNFAAVMHILQKLSPVICFGVFIFVSQGGLQVRWFIFVPFCFSVLSSTMTWQKSCSSSRTNAATSFSLARQSGMNYLSMYLARFCLFDWFVWHSG